MNRVLRAALVGTGRIAAEHLACLSALPDAEVVAVCDLHPVAAEAAATRFGVPGWFTDHREMLERAQADVVHVATPAPSHPVLVADALAAGAHVLVEKPIAHSREDVETMLEQARAAGRHLVENHNYVWDPAIRRIRALVDRGDLGAVAHVDVELFLDIASPGSSYADPNLPHPALSGPGGAIMEFATHLCSLAHAFAGPHESVRALWRRRRPDTPVPHDELRALIAGHDATAALCFSANVAPALFGVRVSGSRRRAAASLFDSRLVVTRERGGPLGSTLGALAESRDLAAGSATSFWHKLQGRPGSYQGLWNLIDALYGAVREGGPPPVTPEQVLEVNRLVFDLVDGADRL